MQSFKLQYILTYQNTHLSEHSLIRTLIDAHCACAMTSAVNYIASGPMLLRYKEIDHECMADHLI